MRQRFGSRYDHVVREHLVPRARAMRLEPTRSEAILWQELRGRALGVRFRRQVVLHAMIVDFFAPSVPLIVEVDGGVHRASRDRDRLRDEFFARRGVRTLRIEAGLVETRAHVAVALVRRALAR